MENSGIALEQKLRAEGERTLTFFKSLSAQSWAQIVFEGEGDQQWSVRDVFEHLITSEEGLRLIFRDVASGGPGVQEGFSIDESNQRAKGKLAGLSLDQLFERYLACRHRTSDFAGTLSDAKLATVGRHPFLGPSKLEDMLRLVNLHNSMHVKDVKKAINK